MKIDPEHFALVCFLVLMENGEGILDKHLDYITEKSDMWNDGYEAFGKLDIHNMRKVKLWCDKWGVEMPEGPAEYLARSEEAIIELEKRGVIL